MASPNTIKQGSVMEGIFAMYCAAFLVDPEDGKSKSLAGKYKSVLNVNSNNAYKIRKAIELGDFNKANLYLGRHFEINGKSLKEKV